MNNPTSGTSLRKILCLLSTACCVAFANTAAQAPINAKDRSAHGTRDIKKTLPCDTLELKKRISESEATARNKGLSDEETAKLVFDYEDLFRKQRQLAALHPQAEVELRELQEKLSTLKTKEERRQALDEHVAIRRALNLQPEASK